MATSDESRQKRLDALNRGPLEHKESPSELADLRRRLRKSRKDEQDTPADTTRPPAADAQPGLRPGGCEPIILRRDLPAARKTPVESYAPPAGPHVELDKAVAGEDITTPDGRRVFFVQREVADGFDESATLCKSLAAALADRSSGLWAQLRHIGIEGEVKPEDLIFFDLETTGLSSSPLFLIGAMVWQDGRLVSHQFFARDYSQEAGVVQLFGALAGERKLLVSFNGKSFDAPFVLTRAAANGVSCRLDHAHLDLLHAARRAWRTRLPDCRLQTLECYICGRTRTDDIPGHMIPDAYHAYVRTGNACQMAGVLEHNFLDMVTLADLMTRLPASPNK